MQTHSLTHSVGGGKTKPVSRCPFHRGNKQPNAAVDSAQLGNKPQVPSISQAELTAFMAGKLNNPAAALEELHQEFGPAFQVQTQDGLLHFDHHPDTMRKALMKTENREPEFEKSERQTHGLARLLGEENLFLADGPDWKSTRSTLAPFFSAKNIKTDAKASAIAAIVDKHLDRLDASLGAKGQAQVDLLPVMRKATLEVALNQILGASPSEQELDRLYQAFTVANERVGQEWLLPAKVTGLAEPASEFEKASGVLKSWAADLVDKRTRAGSDKTDALSLLMTAKDPGSGEPYSREHLTSEVLNLMLAGHETTANLLSWTLTDLARKPQNQDEVRVQLQGLGGRVPSVADLKALDPVTAAWKNQATEHPPNFLIAREALHDTTVGPKDSPVSLKAGTTLIVGTELANEQYGRGMFSFGGGRRFCLGAQLAGLETEVVLTRFLQRFEVSDTGPRGVASGVAQSPADTQVLVSRCL